MLIFILGTMLGGTIGAITMCLCTAAKWGDNNSRQPLALSRQLVEVDIIRPCHVKQRNMNPLQGRALRVRKHNKYFQHGRPLVVPTISAVSLQGRRSVAREYQYNNAIYKNGHEKRADNIRPYKQIYVT